MVEQLDRFSGLMLPVSLLMITVTIAVGLGQMFHKHMIPLLIGNWFLDDDDGWRR